MAPSHDASEPRDAFSADVLEALLDQLPEGITIASADGTIVGANAAAASILNDVKPDDMRVRFDAWADDFVVRDAAGRELRPIDWPIARALRGEHVERFAVATTNLRTGEELLHEVDAGPVIDAGGRVAFAISLRRDVTGERRERERLERLYASEHVAKQGAERANDLLVRLNGLAVELGRVLTPRAVAEASARLARVAADATGVTIVRLRSNGATVRTIASAGFPPDLVEAWREFGVDAPAPLAEAVRTDEPVFVSSATERRARFVGMSERSGEGVSHSWACFPLHMTGIVSGAIGFGFPHARTFPETDAAFLSAIAEQVSTALERAALLEDSERARIEAEAAVGRTRRLDLVTDAALTGMPFEPLVNELVRRMSDRASTKDDVQLLQLLGAGVASALERASLSGEA